jgi:integrase
LVVGELLFPGPRGGPVAIPVPWSRLTRKKEITPHVVRHSYATLAIELGVPEATVAALLGHAKTAVTAGYIHARVKHLVEAADVISRANPHARVQGKQRRRADPTQGA